MNASPSGVAAADGAARRVDIPRSHQDLLTGSAHGVLTTVGPDGMPHSAIVWVDFDGQCALVNTTLERASGRNMLRDSRVSLLVADRENPSRYLAVRGDVEFVCDGALAHLDQLTRRYTLHGHFYGGVYPCERQFEETRVICRIHAQRVNVDAIHA